METKLRRIASIIKSNPKTKFTSLYHLINKELLIKCHHVENRDFCNVVPLVMFKGIAKNNTYDPAHICYHELGHFICEYV